MAHKALREIYADWLRDQLDRPGWTVSRVAREAGVSRETVYRVLKGEGGTFNGTMHRLSEALGHPLPEVAPVVRGPETGPSSPVAPRSTEERASTKAQRAIVAEAEARLLNGSPRQVSAEEVLGWLYRMLRAGEATPPGPSPGPSAPEGG